LVSKRKNALTSASGLLARSKKKTLEQAKKFAASLVERKLAAYQVAKKTARGFIEQSK